MELCIAKEVGTLYGVILSVFYVISIFRSLLEITPCEHYFYVPCLIMTSQWVMTLLDMSIVMSQWVLMLLCVHIMPSQWIMALVSEPLLLCITMPNYDIAVCPVKNFKIVDKTSTSNQSWFCVTREVGTLSVLTPFEIFITKICMKVPGIWHKKTWKKLEFRTKNLEKTCNLVFWKRGNPVHYMDLFRNKFDWNKIDPCSTQPSWFVISRLALFCLFEKQFSWIEIQF